MNITTKTNNDLNYVLLINIEKNDYAETVDKALRKYRQKVNMPGFRAGKVPMGMVKKLYGRTILVDEINKLISENLTKHIVDNKLNLLGEPLPSEKEQKEIDWDNQEDFEFAYDYAVAPEIKINLNKKNKIVYYKINIDDDMLKTYIDNYRARYGEYKIVDEVKKDELIECSLTEIKDDGEGLKVDDAKILLSSFKDEKIKAKFVGKKPNGTITIDLKKAVGDNKTEFAALLHKKTEELDGISNKFKIKIHKIKTFEKAELNQEFFDKVYGKDVVKSEKEFIAKVKEEIANNHIADCDYRFRIDAKEKLLATLDIKLPDEFLKRWLLVSNQKGENKLSPEQIEKEYPLFADDLKWQLIKDTVVKEQEIKISDEQITEAAKEFARYQFQQYGLGYVPDESLMQYVDELLKNNDEKRKLIDNEIDKAVVNWIKETVKLDEKEISFEDFNKLFEKK